MKIVEQDITKANVDCIVQQTNCLTTRPHGLADTIYRKLGVCPYVDKKSSGRGNGNLCRNQDISKPGTVDMMRANNKDQWVACLYGQFTPGKSGVYYRDICRDHGIIETNRQREQWFQESLDELLDLVEIHGIKTIGFPYLIGCGLAGGDWAKYLEMIKGFESKTKASITLYKYVG